MFYLTAGTKIRAFTLTECLGKGGMSAVWKAHHAETGQDYALKILHGSVVDDDQVRLRFFEEGLIQSRVAHPNVVAVKGRIEEHPVHALVMEFVDGPSLADYIAERPGGLFLPEVKAIATGILSGLNAAHRRGIVHRDIKPSNVLLARDFYTITPKVTDFGIAKVKFGRLKTVTSSPMGTPHFMSPEQLRDSKRVTVQSDIYSFGISLYHMVTSHFPFDGDDLNALMLKIIQGGHQAPSYHREDLPPELDELIERCIAPRPQDRPENCREVLEAILAIDWNQPDAPRKASSPKRATQPGAPVRPPAKSKGGSSRQVGGSPPGSAARAAPNSEERSLSGPRAAVRQLTPPPIPSVPPQRLTTPAPAGRRPPAARPSGPLAEVESGEWRLSSSQPEVDLSGEESAIRFKRRSMVPLIVGLLALVGVAAASTKLILDWRADQAAEERAQVEGTDGSGAATTVAAPAPSARGVDPIPELPTAVGLQNTTPSPGRPGGAGLATNLPTDGPALGETAAGETIAAPGRGEPAPTEIPEAIVVESPSLAAVTPPAPVPTVALLAAEDESEGSPEAPTGALLEPAAEPQPEPAAASDRAEATTVVERPPRGETSARQSERELDRQSTERVAGREDGLVGRERERAAEEAWRERQGTTPTDTSLPPTIHATGPNDDPSNDLGASANPTVIVATPPPSPTPPEASEELSPIQINRVLGQSRGELRACFEGFDVPPVEMRIRITPEGSVSFARALDQTANGQVVSCLVRELGRLHFDAYDGQAMNIRRTFNRIGPM